MRLCALNFWEVSHVTDLEQITFKRSVMSQIYTNIISDVIFGNMSYVLSSSNKAPQL